MCVVRDRLRCGRSGSFGFGSRTGDAIGLRGTIKQSRTFPMQHVRLSVVMYESADSVCVCSSLTFTSLNVIIIYLLLKNDCAINCVLSSL